MRAALLLLLVLVAPVAYAQVPPAVTACGTISIPADPASPAPVPGGGRADIVVDVENAGQLAATVTVTATTSAPGWLIVSSPAPATVGGQTTGSFTVTVEATPDAGGDALVLLAASGTCDSPLGGQCPPQACNAGNANAQVNVPFQPADGFQFPGLGALNVPLEYLVAGIVLVGLATAIPLAMRRNKGGIVADCPEPLKMVKPGRGTSFPIELRNGAKEPSSAQFEVGPVPEGWSAFMPLPEVQLAGREARSLWLMVRSPANAAQGDAVDVELRLRDARGKNGSVVKVRAEVQGTAEG